MKDQRRLIIELDNFHSQVHEECFHNFHRARLFGFFAVRKCEIDWIAAVCGREPMKILCART